MKEGDLLQIPRRFADEMVAHALEEEPNECCGLLAGREGQAARLYRIANSEQSPTRFFMEPQELYNAYKDIEENGWELLAIYHSHPHGKAYPSATDVELASWPDAVNIVISLLDRVRPEIRAFRIVDGRIAEAEMEIVG